MKYTSASNNPVSVMVNTHGTGTLPEEALAGLVRQLFPLSPKGMIDHLKLRQPVFLKTAAYGHFGRPEFTWERVDYWLRQTGSELLT